MTPQEIAMIDKIEQKRTEIARALFSPHYPYHRASMAKKVVALAVELVELEGLCEGARRQR